MSPGCSSQSFTHRCQRNGEMAPAPNSGRLIDEPEPTADHCQRSSVTTTLPAPAGIGSSSRSLKPGALTSTM